MKPTAAPEATSVCVWPRSSAGDADHPSAYRSGQACRVFPLPPCHRAQRRDWPRRHAGRPPVPPWGRSGRGPGRPTTAPAPPSHRERDRGRRAIGDQPGRGLAHCGQKCVERRSFRNLGIELALVAPPDTVISCPVAAFRSAASFSAGLTKFVATATSAVSAWARTGIAAAASARMGEAMMAISGYIWREITKCRTGTQAIFLLMHIDRRATACPAARAAFLHYGFNRTASGPSGKSGGGSLSGGPIPTPPSDGMSPRKKEPAPAKVPVSDQVTAASKAPR